MQFTVETDRQRAVVVVTDARGRREEIPLTLATHLSSATVQPYASAPSQKVIVLAE